MLYTLIGNGEANTKEVLHTLQSLRDAVPETEDVWFLFQEPGPEQSLSNTMDAVLKWVISEQIYYEIVVQEGGEVTTYMSADEIHQAKRPLSRMLTLTKGRVQPPELSAVLILSDNIEQDQDALFAINQAIAQDIPVFDLGGQMVALELEADEPSKPQEQPEQPEVAAPEETTVPVVLDNNGFTLPVEDDDAPEEPELEFTRADLEALTRDELKSLATVRKLTVKDWRSKDSLIAALMHEEDQPAPAPAPEPVTQAPLGDEEAVLPPPPLIATQIRIVRYPVEIDRAKKEAEATLEEVIGDGYTLLSTVGLEGWVVYTLLRQSTLAYSNGG